MTQSAPALIEVDKIDIEEGFNARSHMDDSGLESLAESLAESGVVQSIAVRPSGNGRYSVVAGHRRITAARMGGVEKVPVLIREGSRAEALRDSLIENLHQETLDDIDQARGIRALAEEWSLTTNREIAEKLKLKAPRVGLLLRLLELPEGVQRLIAAGVIPSSAERQLRMVAAVSPRIAECVCEYAVRKKIDKSDFVRRFDEILLKTTSARFEDKPTMIPVNEVRFSKVVLDKVKRRDLTARFNALVRWDWEISEDPVITLAEVEIDAARAAGCLVEHVVDHGDYVKSTALVTDADFTADLIERAIAAREKAAAAEAEAREKLAAERKGTSDAQKEEAKEARRAQHKEREEKKVKGRRFNEDLHVNLQQRKASTRKQYGLARIKAIGAILIANNPQLAGRGARLVNPQLQDIDVKTLKSGEAREKVSYASPEQATDFLATKLAEARTEGEALELLSNAILCAMVADDNVVPQGKRSYWYTGAEVEVAKLLAPEIKEVKPRRRGAKRS